LAVMIIGGWTNCTNLRRRTALEVAEGGFRGQQNLLRA